MRARLALDGKRLEAAYEVRYPEIRANPALAPGEPQWGLWDWDVVELFVRAIGERGPAYYEFQASPLGQQFELEILEPRKRVNREYRSGFSVSATRGTAGYWAATISVPLGAIGWDGGMESIVGGAFAILGAPGARTYWASFLDPQSRPDFHLPDRFKPLFPGGFE